MIKAWFGMKSVVKTKWHNDYESIVVVFVGNTGVMVTYTVMALLDHVRPICVQSMGERKKNSGSLFKFVGIDMATIYSWWFSISLVIARTNYDFDIKAGTTYPTSKECLHFNIWKPYIIVAVYRVKRLEGYRLSRNKLALTRLQPLY